MTCPFCTIMAGELPALVVAQDEHSLALLPLEMEAPGHCLVIPKNHAKDLFSISIRDLEACMAMAQKIAKRMRERLGATGVNILHASGKDAQQTVFHLHFHIIPRFPNDGIDAWMKKKNPVEDREKFHELLR